MDNRKKQITRTEKMIIKCEYSVRPKASERIEGELCSISENEDVLAFNINREEGML